MRVQFQAGVQCARKLGCPRAKWAVLGLPRCVGPGGALCLRVCACVRVYVGVHGLQWFGRGCVCATWAGVSPWWVQEMCSEKLQGISWEFLRESGISPCWRRWEVPAGEPHGAATCRWRGKEREVVVRGEYLLPPAKWKWELSLHLGCVFRFQALQAGAVPYCLYSPWPGKSWSLPGHPGTSAVLMSNNRLCDINSSCALYSNPWLHGQAGSQKKKTTSRRVILFRYEGRDASAHRSATACGNGGRNGFPRGSWMKFDQRLKHSMEMFVGQGSICELVSKGLRNRKSF